jgi:hypothetical protein
MHGNPTGSGDAHGANLVIAIDPNAGVNRGTMAFDVIFLKEFDNCSFNAPYKPRKRK